MAVQRHSKLKISTNVRTYARRERACPSPISDLALNGVTSQVMSQLSSQVHQRMTRRTATLPRLLASSSSSSRRSRAFRRAPSRVRDRHRWRLHSSPSRCCRPITRLIMRAGQAWFSRLTARTVQQAGLSRRIRTSGSDPMGKFIKSSWNASVPRRSTTWGTGQPCSAGATSRSRLDSAP